MFHKISEVSKDFGVSEAQLTYIINNEAAKTSNGDFLPCGDGDLHMGYSNRSRGVAQINRKYHPDISDKEAYDVDFALEWTASRLREGKCDMWSTCRAYKKKYV